MTDDSKDPPGTDQDKILDELDTFLSKRQGKTATVTESKTKTESVTVPVLTQVFGANSRQSHPSGSSDVPTLTEVVSYPTPHSAASIETTPPLQRIVDAALIEAGVGLDKSSQELLVRSLERHLQGYSATPPQNQSGDGNLGAGIPVSQNPSRSILVPAPSHSSIITDLSAAADSRPIRMTTMELAKSFEPQPIESHWYSIWEDAGYFKPMANDAPSEMVPPYCIMLPPPNVTGTLHMGHAFQHTLMDALSRYHRMLGNNTLWQPGTDHAGIATQIVVERQLDQQNIKRQDLGREEFINRVWQWKEESGSTITRQMRRMGTSCDWSRKRFTMDEGLSRAVTEVFVRLHTEGLIYRGKRLVNWDPVLQTAVSDLEVISTEEDGSLWHIRYPLAEPDLQNGLTHLIVATPDPRPCLGIWRLPCIRMTLVTDT